MDEVDTTQSEPLASAGDSDGRSTNGRFAPGNRIGRGNPFGKRVNAIRQQILDAVSDDDLEAIVRKLVELAREGDIPAAREVLDRIAGKAIQKNENEDVTERPPDDGGFTDLLPLATFDELATLRGIFETLKQRKAAGILPGAIQEN